MLADAPFAAARLSLLRMAIAPHGTASDTAADLDLDDPAQAGAIRDHVLGLVADPLVREAIEVSSPSTGQALDALAAGVPMPLSRLRRLALTLTGYRLRMATRATPFGLMAGVAVADNSDQGTKVRLGAEHRKSVHVDRGWLDVVLRRWEQDPEILTHVRVTTNDLVFQRGDRLVLPYVPVHDSADQARPVETSVRASALVTQVVEAASHPIAFPDLVEQVLSAHPAAPRHRAVGLITGLIAQNVLLTNLRPPANATDPMLHVLDVLADAADTPELAVLREVHARAADYAAEPLGSGLPALRTATVKARTLHPDGDQLQIDLAVDADVRVHRQVAEEAVEAATVLWRLTPQVARYHHLHSYHAEFLERYGAGRLVPVKELLHGAGGLGAPAGYQLPAATRTGTHTPSMDSTALLELAQRAAWHRQREVVLDEELVARLAAEPPDAPTEAVDFCAALLSPSAQALDAGDFRLVAAPIPGTLGGTYSGRFCNLLPELAGQLSETVSPAGDLPVQLAFETGAARLGNVSAVPRVLTHQVSVGVFADRGDQHELGLDDLVVHGTLDGLQVRSLSLGRAVRPNPLHMVNLWTLAPNIARLLVELPRTGHRLWSGWSWGAAQRLPFLPRVRHGRTVLSPARWTPPIELSTSDDSWPAWRDRFHAWRTEWEMPAAVQVSRGDNRIELNLDSELHLRLLRDRLRRNPDSELLEQPCGGEYDAGWLEGHANEIVFSLRPTAVVPEETTSVAPMRTNRLTHAPGGEWLFAKLYAPEPNHDALLTRRLPELLGALPDSVDRWFFLRYRDPEPHLRLRLHGDPGELAAHLLPSVHDWAADLRSRGESSRLVLDNYDPELERYGGPELITAAERVFHADSIAAITQLARKAAHRTELLAAANYADLLREFGEPDWMSWLVRKFPQLERRAAFRRNRADALRLLDLTGDWDVLRELDPVVSEAFAARSAAVREYGELFRGLSDPWSTSDTVQSALLHMHHNRLVGIDRHAETDSLAVVVGTVRAHLSRLKAIGS